VRELIVSFVVVGGASVFSTRRSNAALDAQAAAIRSIVSAALNVPEASVLTGSVTFDSATETVTVRLSVEAALEQDPVPLVRTALTLPASVSALNDVYRGSGGSGAGVSIVVVSVAFTSVPPPPSTARSQPTFTLSRPPTTAPTLVPVPTPAPTRVVYLVNVTLTPNASRSDVTLWLSDIVGASQDVTQRVVSDDSSPVRFVVFAVTSQLTLAELTVAITNSNRAAVGVVAFSCAVDQSPLSPDSSNSSVGVIVGTCVGGMLFIFAVVIAALYFKRRQRTREHEEAAVKACPPPLPLLALPQPLAAGKLRGASAVSTLLFDSKDEPPSVFEFELQNDRHAPLQQRNSAFLATAFPPTVTPGNASSAGVPTPRSSLLI